ncbi:hypothetical protein [Sinomicrobium oceani]|uniref:hypothetical protein n=1 Tax=Sinomicrobium oceani TaxID=1150368 RepID=UPI00227D1FEC|nr:hypothetical protein [Sinomicrobium oceani]
MRNILVTNFDNSGENIMLFTNKQTVERMQNKLDEQKVHYDDIIEVPEGERQYYLFEPYWLNDWNY